MKLSKDLPKNKRKKNPTYYCKVCDLLTSDKNDYKRHLLTAKHFSSKNGYKKLKGVEFYCETCGKGYKHRSGLSRHKKRCKSSVDKSVESVGKMGNCYPSYHSEKGNVQNEFSEVENTQKSNKSNPNKIKTEKEDEINALKIEILKKELKHKDQIIEIYKTNGNTTNNTNNFNNCNNKNLTVNVYLNEHCKDAMNLTDFVNQITVQLEDILYQDRTTSAEGLSNIITKQLKNLEPTERPIHCSDQSRQHFYIKEGEGWTQKKGDKEMEQSVRQIQIKQLSALKEWEDKHPNFMDDERLQNKYTKYMEKIMYGCGDKNKMDKNVKAVKKKISQDIMIKDAMDDLKVGDDD